MRASSSREFLQADGLAQQLLRLELAGEDHGQHGGVLVGLHAVAAQDFQLVGDDPVHGHGGVVLVAQHQPHLHVLAALAQAGDGIEAGRRAAQRVDGDVRAALGDLPHALHHPFVRGVHRGRRADGARESELLRADVHGHHVGPQRAGDHDGREAHPAAAVHRHPLPTRHPALVHQRPKRGGEAAAQAGGGHVVQPVRQAHQVGVGVIDGHVFGEGSPPGEARLELVVAHLLVARLALWAGAAPAHEGQRDALAHPPAGDLLAGGFHHAGQLVTGHVRQADVRVVAHPAVPVAAAQAGGLHAQDHSARAGRRVGHVLDAQGCGKLCEDGCFQGYLPNSR